LGLTLKAPQEDTGNDYGRATIHQNRCDKHLVPPRSRSRRISTFLSRCPRQVASTRTRSASQLVGVRRRH
jgi:hypothetical protein